MFQSIIKNECSKKYLKKIMFLALYVGVFKLKVKKYALFDGIYLERRAVLVICEETKV